MHTPSSRTCTALARVGASDQRMMLLMLQSSRCAACAGCAGSPASFIWVCCCCAFTRTKKTCPASPEQVRTQITGDRGVLHCITVLILVLRYRLEETTCPHIAGGCGEGGCATPRAIHSLFTEEYRFPATLRRLCSAISAPSAPHGFPHSWIKTHPLPDGPPLSLHVGQSRTRLQGWRHLANGGRWTS